MSKSDTRNHSTLLAKSEKARRVEDHHRNLNKKNHVDSHLNVKRTGFVSNSNNVCNMCNECLIFVNHDKCVVHTLKSVKFVVTDYTLSDQKAGSKGISGSTNCPLVSGFRMFTTYDRTASIRESGTSVLEDLKALSWKTCQEGSLLNLSDH
ncbi:hypothetical protein Tco_0368480, partial [Tanacetum coccineum]